MDGLSLALLGPFDATLDGRPVEAFESAKVRALLAYLALEAGRPYPRQRLADLLWPDHPEEAARTYLRQALANLRRLLSTPAAVEPILLIEREVVQFNERSAYRLDVATFLTLLADCERHQHRHAPSCSACRQRLAAAVALYRGDLLDGLWPEASGPFEDWVTVQREGLRLRYLEALNRLAAAAGWARRYAEMRVHAERQLALDPWREEAHRQLMQAFYLCGQRSAALAQYERCRAMLARELRVAPTQATDDLYARLRDADALLPHSEARALALGLPVAPHAPTLPAPSTAFLGRERERAHVAELLQDPACRLITLVGPGGMGKTRLALQIAAEQYETFADGVCVVSLAALHNATSIVPAIASALGVRLDGSAESAAALIDHLRRREMLLVLDNAEHLAGGVEVLAAILERVAGLRLLVTSRERLALRGEWAVELGGLAYPDDGVGPDVHNGVGPDVHNGVGPQTASDIAVIESYSAVQLFVQSARRARGGFVLTATDRAAVLHLCRLVEGLPLAVELAASWVRALTCPEIVGEIERNLDVLSTTLRELPARHRSMRAVFDQSWRLLSADEQRVLRRLSVFRGGFDRVAAMEVAETDFPDLARLVDRSLVRWTGTRYDLHELVRHYAHEQLERAGEANQTHKRHCDVYLRLAEEVDPWLADGEQSAWLERLEADGGNLRAALAWARAHQDWETVVRLGGGLWWFWWLRGHSDEGQQWLDDIIRIAAEGRERPGEISAGLWARALHGAGWLSIRQRAFAQATGLLEQSLRVATQADDAPRRAAVLLHLSQAARLQGHYPRALDLHEETAVYARRIGLERIEGGALGMMGATWHAVGDDARARPLLEHGLTRSRAVGDAVLTAWCLSFLGRVLKETAGQEAGAAPYLAEALATFQGLGDRDGLAFTLEGFAGLAARYSQSEQAARLFGAVEALREAIHAPMAPCDRPEYERDVRSVRDTLDHAAFERAWNVGRAMSLEHAIRDALTVQHRPTPV